jgi:hypothetical protein
MRNWRKGRGLGEIEMLEYKSCKKDRGKILEKQQKWCDWLVSDKRMSWKSRWME